MKYLSYIVLVLLIVSCGGEGKKKIKKPKGLISKEKMANVIYDMSLLNAVQGGKRLLMEQDGLNTANYIYEKHGIDSTQFAQSNEYYAFDLDAYEEIYQNVKTKLEQEKKRYSDLVKVEDKERDSINNERRKKRDSLTEIQKKNRAAKTIPTPNGQIKSIDSLKKPLRQQQ